MNGWGEENTRFVVNAGKVNVDFGVVLYVGFWVVVEAAIEGAEVVEVGIVLVAVTGEYVEVVPILRIGSIEFTISTSKTVQMFDNDFNTITMITYSNQL